MTRELSEGLGDIGLLSLLRSPFLFPSLAIHLLALYLVLALKPIAPREINAPIPIQLLELGGGGSPDKSIGPSRGPGGPRSMPKLGSPVPPRQQVGKLDKSAVEASAPTNEAASSTPPALPGPKTLADTARPEPLSVSETSPDSLVQLPTRQSSGSLPASVHIEVNQKTQAVVEPAGDVADIRALKAGTQIPGALKGSGSNAGPYGVPGGGKTGTGIAGRGSGSGTGGGSYTGLKGAASGDYEQYFKQIERRVRSVWRYPDKVTGLHNLRVRFTVDRAGKLLQAEVVDSTDARLNTSAIEAMKKASPFPPLPESIKDIAGDPLIIRFTVGNRVKS
ncbi:MAG: TonB family protein [Candidatus Binatia bacterium]